MRLLRFAGPAEDGHHLVVEAFDNGERFLLDVDDRFREAARSDLPRLGRLEPVGDIVLTPKEIQTRVRAGAAPEQIAADAGVSNDRVLRFAYSVLQERSRVAGEALRSRARKGSADGPLVLFGETVEARFTAHGVNPNTVRWDAVRPDDGDWHVLAIWRGGDTERTAKWSFSLTGRVLTPLEPTAEELLSDRPVQPVEPTLGRNGLRSVRPGETLPSSQVDDGFFDQDAPQVVGPGTGISLAGPLAPSRSESDLNRRIAARLADKLAKDTPTDAILAEFGGDGPSDIADDDDVAPDEAFTDAVPVISAVPVIGAHHAPTVDDGAIPLPFDVVDAGAETEQNDERARIPSWDDILLGVRPKHD